MLRRLSYHLKLTLKRLMDDMLWQTIIFFLVAAGMIVLYSFFPSRLLLWLLWLVGLAYAVSYFSRLMLMDEIIREGDPTKGNRLFISKAIWLHY